MLNRLFAYSALAAIVLTAFPTTSAEAWNSGGAASGGAKGTARGTGTLLPGRSLPDYSKKSTVTVPNLRPGRSMPESLAGQRLNGSKKTGNQGGQPRTSTGKTPGASAYGHYTPGAFVKKK